MIRNLASEMPVLHHVDENDILDNKTLAYYKPYFDVILEEASAEEKIQWFYNLFYVSKHIDLGLGHSIQHNQAARNYAYMCDDDILKHKIFNDPFEDIIGASTNGKPSDTIRLNNNILSGSKNWFTNLATASYISLEVTDEKNVVNRIVVDLQQVEHEIDDNFPKLLGLRHARPYNISFNDIKIPNNWVVGQKAYPDPMFSVEALHHLAFLTNLTAITSALFDEVYAFAKDTNHATDISVLKLQIDVITCIDNWIKRLNFFYTDENIFSEAWLLQHDQLYYFGKKTLLQTISVARDFGIQAHTIAEGDISRTFRNAVAFSSHMQKLYNFKNDWANKTFFDMDKYIEHYMNKHIRHIDIPETL
jgi:hypothetical protein